MDRSALITSIAAMLGHPAHEIQVEPWTAGGNNRIFRVHLPAGKAMVAKCYYAQRASGHDRLHAEWYFTNYARSAGINDVPVPIAHDLSRQIALYEFVDGRKLPAAEIDQAQIEEAAVFLRRLNDPAAVPFAGDLPRASEACFSIGEHFLVVERRIQLLRNVDWTQDREAFTFVETLNDTWSSCKSKVLTDSAKIGLSLEVELPDRERWVSPSDFGFHNMLVRPDGRICFIDFEYGGWDDPAKTINDFFCQPAVPVDERYFDAFLNMASQSGQITEYFISRVLLLQPIFRVKWCCIMLNAFVPELAARRQFADPSTDMMALKKEQLLKAKAALARIRL